MKLLVFTILAVSCAVSCVGKEVKESLKKVDDKKTDKRGAVEIQTSSSAYITPTPSLATVSHGAQVIPLGTSAPGIVYAPEKQIVATASPSQLYAKASPNLPKISDAVLAGQGPVYQGILPNHVYQQQQQVLQPLTKFGFNSPQYAVSAPIASHLAYSKHQVLLPQYQQQIYQPQVSYLPQVYQQPIAYQQQLGHQQVYQPHQQVYQQQLGHQLYQQQLGHQVAYAQPQVAAYSPVVAKLSYAQAPIVAQQVYAAQPVATKGDGAVSYSSFSQGHGDQYAAKVIAPQAAVLAKQVVTPQVFPQQYYQQAQHYQHSYLPQAQVYHNQQQVLLPQAQVYHALPQVYHAQPQVYHAQPQAYHSQPQVYHQQLYQQPQVYQQTHQVYQQPQVYASGKAAYAQPQGTVQYFGKTAQNNAYSAYNH